MDHVFINTDLHDELCFWNVSTLTHFDQTHVSRAFRSIFAFSRWNVLARTNFTPSFWYKDVSYEVVIGIGCKLVKEKLIISSNCCRNLHDLARHLRSVIYTAHAIPWRVEIDSKLAKEAWASDRKVSKLRLNIKR